MPQPGAWLQNIPRASPSRRLSSWSMVCRRSRYCHGPGKRATPQRSTFVNIGFIGLVTPGGAVAGRGGGRGTAGGGLSGQP